MILFLSEIFLKDERMFFFHIVMSECIFCEEKSYSLGNFPHYFGNNHMKIPKIFQLGEENVITDSLTSFVSSSICQLKIQRQKCLKIKINYHVLFIFTQTDFFFSLLSPLGAFQRKQKSRSFARSIGKIRYVNAAKREFSASYLHPTRFFPVWP